MRIKSYVLPGMILAGTIGLLFASELTSGNILLNGLAITFLVQVDDTFYSLLLHSSFTEKVDNAYEEANESVGEVVNEGWLVRRLYGGFMYVISCVFVLSPTSTIEKFGDGGTLCTDMRTLFFAAQAFSCFGIVLSKAPTLLMDVGRAAKGPELTPDAPEPKVAVASSALDLVMTMLVGYWTFSFLFYDFYLLHLSGIERTPLGLAHRIFFSA